MSYIEDGHIQKERSYFRLSIISEAIWGAINFIGSFLSSIISPGASGRANPRDSRSGRIRYDIRPPGGVRRFGKFNIAGYGKYKGISGG